MTRIKICGITRLEDALLAIRLGADALGFVFYPPSPRNITLENAKKIIANLPPFVTTVGLFVNENPIRIKEILNAVSLDLLQLHGEETPEYCNNLQMPYIKTLKIQPSIDITDSAKKYMATRAILLDTFHAQQAGGTGQVFNWDLIPTELNKPLILAGGLNSKNIEEAIAKIKPYAVDVSSSVEAAPGIKDPDKLAAFIQKVRKQDSSNK